MRGMIWNMRGFGRLDHRSQLAKTLHAEKLDFIGIQETIKSSISVVDLRSIGGDDFTWNWLSANGRSRGILVGVWLESFNVSRVFISVVVVQRNNQFRWELVIVYGSADHSKSVDFLVELHDKICASTARGHW